MNPPVSSGTLPCASCGAAQRASDAAMPAFTEPGIMRVLNGGDTISQVAARTSASAKAVRTSGSIVNVTRDQVLGDEVRDHLEQAAREVDDLRQHPIAADHEHESDAG